MEEKREERERELVADPDSNAGQCAHRVCIRVCTVCVRVYALCTKRTRGKQGDSRTRKDSSFLFVFISPPRFKEREQHKVAPCAIRLSSWVQLQ